MREQCLWGSGSGCHSACRRGSSEMGLRRAEHEEREGSEIQKRRDLKRGDVAGIRKRGRKGIWPGGL